MLSRVAGLRACFGQLANKELVMSQLRHELKPDEYSGLTVTVFGGTGMCGYYVGKALGMLGCDMIYPHCFEYPFSDQVRFLKLTAPIKRAYIHPQMDFNDQDLIERMIRHSDVVINLLGPRWDIKRLQDFEKVNIKFASRIALAAKRNPRVKRLVHFSAAAACPDSESFDFRTKHFGQGEVRSIYPQATVLAPCSIYGMGDRFAMSYIKQCFDLYGRNVIFSDLTARKQPIYVEDIAECVKNVVRLEEAKGQRFVLGGPYVHSLKEIFEITMNHYTQEPKLLYFPREVALAYANHKLGLNWKYLNRERVIKEGLDEVVPTGVKDASHLMVRPVSFRQGVADLNPHYEDQTPGIKDTRYSS